jgi:hypothetical protein
MKLAIMQPYFFPYIGYYQLINSVDKFILYDNLNYIKKGWIHRNRLLIAKGSPEYFGVPVRDASSFRKIRDIEIDNSNNWKDSLLKLIYYNYKSALYFNEIFPFVEKLFEHNDNYISEINYRTIKEVSDFLHIETEIQTENMKYSNLEHELCNTDSEIVEVYKKTNPSVVTKDVRVLYICKNERAEIYINPIGGTTLYNKRMFEEYGVKLFFIKTLPYQYSQRSDQFFPHLSIIDVMMNCGKNVTINLLNWYEMV